MMLLAALSDIPPVLRATLSVSLLLGALGIWLMLPRGGRAAQLAGKLLSLIAVGLFGASLPIEASLYQTVFWCLALLTLVSAGATISMRSPVYSAVWFALSLLGTAGLFMMQDAHFLAVATVVVYAGAIVVTFLFVLMLAQPEGLDTYDRLSLGRLSKLVSVAAGVAIIGGLTGLILQLPDTGVADAVAAGSATVPETATDSARQNAAESVPENATLSANHVASLGAELFSKHLIAVELAGTLLLVALVGAVAIVIHGRERRQSDDAAQVESAG